MVQLPSLPGAVVVRALERAGFSIIRVSGSHHRLRHPDGRVTTVPVHSGRDVPRGTLRAVLRQCDLSPDEFRRYLR